MEPGQLLFECQNRREEVAMAFNPFYNVRGFKRQ
jgi:hypothetical protein